MTVRPLQEQLGRLPALGSIFPLETELALEQQAADLRRRESCPPRLFPRSGKMLERLRPIPLHPCLQAQKVVRIGL